VDCSEAPEARRLDGGSVVWQRTLIICARGPRKGTRRRVCRRGRRERRDAPPVGQSSRQSLYDTTDPAGLTALGSTQDPISRYSRRKNFGRRFLYSMPYIHFLNTIHMNTLEYSRNEIFCYSRFMIGPAFILFIFMIDRAIPYSTQLKCIQVHEKPCITVASLPYTRKYSNHVSRMTAPHTGPGVLTTSWEVTGVLYPLTDESTSLCSDLASGPSGGRMVMGGAGRVRSHAPSDDVEPL
jgi:hypothetical protein